MFVHLFAAQWLAVIEALGNELPQVRERIATEAARQVDGVVAVEGRVEGWRAVADRLSPRSETADIANLMRLMMAAGNVEW